MYLVSVLLLLAGDIELNPGPSGRRSVAKGPTPEEEILTIQSQLEEIQTKLTQLDTSGAESRTNLNTRTEQLELRVDRALEESITVLKKDYETKIGEIKEMCISTKEPILSFVNA
ncbi:uncharacterized protein LOC111696925 [Eurytemora carolleeae]|uniref:uncharacterized protein LOC111696925 n=1 Tax=Eurytemora carolleeae TaxID=1294199 RepID=UPI000C769F40|nr:uncharacterized protein LOC111696925 [Eurytemora carolleeae]|eukprot:XP_023322483.1 uncharacterized protein LOC111696925 [Eurytemora affinis]